jgi:ABC-type multidrug transport system fused ATPase/permease subunit
MNMQIYQTRAGEYKKEQERHARQLSFTSIARLLLFLLFAWFIYSAFKVRFEGYDLLFALISIIIFLVVVFIADSIRKKVKFLQQLVLINENEIGIRKGIPSFLDNGATYSPAKGFAVDLNVFGKYSLFHLLNRAGSRPGKKQMSEHLSSPFLSSAAIRNYQECIQELSGKIDFRQNLLAHTLSFKEEETLIQLQAGLPPGGFETLQNKFWKFLSICWPLLGVLVIGICVWKDNYALLLAFTITGLLILAVVLKKINLLYFHISKRSYLYNQYARCFRLISEEKFEHPYLQSQQDEIIHASRAFQKLASLTGIFDLRLSILSFFTNGIFLLDLFCALSYLKWNKQHQPHIKNWFDTLGEIELLNSIATFHYNHPSFVFPQPVDDQLHIKATGMGHPLMREDKAVVNDISIGENAKLHLITGSNMSGKSTFLRTLGLNMILAQVGAPVFAKTFVFRPLRLLTSFHHIDSLEESTSYFYAELKCLQDIVHSLPGPQPALVLLDEVMRGTNSKDKHDGTALLIKKLVKHACLSLIATHDTELGVLSEGHPGAVDNFCFESELKNDELTFDFTMRKGVAQSKNATYLMKKMGIV